MLSLVPYCVIFFCIVPSQTQKVDSAFFSMTYIHSVLTLRNRTFSVSDTEDNFLLAITNSPEFKFSPLDVWRLRTELFIFIKRLSKIRVPLDIVDNGSFMYSDSDETKRDTRIPSSL